MSHTNNPNPYNLYLTNNPTIIHVSTSMPSVCQFCHSTAPIVERSTVGATAVLWGVVLCCITGCLCCIPCCIA